jgi:hypothetical protein
LAATFVLCLATPVVKASIWANSCKPSSALSDHAFFWLDKLVFHISHLAIIGVFLVAKAAVNPSAATCPSLWSSVSIRCERIEP